MISRPSGKETFIKLLVSIKSSSPVTFHVSHCLKAGTNLRLGHAANESQTPLCLVRDGFCYD